MPDLFLNLKPLRDIDVERAAESLASSGDVVCVVNADPLVLVYFDDAHAKGKEPYSVDFRAIRLKAGRIEVMHGADRDDAEIDFDLADYEPCPMRVREHQRLAAWTSDLVPRLCRRWREIVQAPVASGRPAKETM